LADGTLRSVRVSMTITPTPRDFSRIAGAITQPPPHQTYRVRYRSLHGSASYRKLPMSILVGLVNVALFVAYIVLLAQSVARTKPSATLAATLANDAVLGSIFLMAGLSLVNVISFTVASIVAQDPVPVVAQPGQRVAFVTAIVPSKESIHTVLRTLIAARKIVYDGTVDVWLLDEGGDRNIAELCAKHGVSYFTRFNEPRYNTKRGAFKARTKHGNYNAWLDAHGAQYDYLASVDNDHQPYPIYLERTLGYLRDPDVAYVVGPQAYGNEENFIARSAESQQFPFHSIIQRAANSYRIPMLVGTNYVIRIAALQQIGGFVDSVTEDMATGLRLHISHNPATQRRWKSVYTPDLLSIGEGPTTWADYFGQQSRWSRGTFEVLKHDMLRRGWRLTPPRLMHYFLITTFYPSMALGWILGALNAVLYLAFGANGISVPVEVWIALYVDTTLFQLWVYARNRRYNVSPVEREGTLGLVGMMMSVVASPIYAAAFVKSLFGRSAAFRVTPKGVMSTRDTLSSFKYHFAWLVVFATATVVALTHGYFTLAVSLWPALAVVTCLVPPVVYLYTRSTLPQEQSDDDLADQPPLQAVKPASEGMSA
jgi:cellulose synthase/poly-beta-1,6-N-acetylglucosamine synthase-like glycosyltransferase